LRGRVSRLAAICLLLAAAAACERDPGRSAEATTPAADATTPRPGPTTAPAGGATTATPPAGYLADAIELIRRNAYYADRVDWPAARAEAHRRAGATREGAYEAIRWVLSELGDGHSLLLTPEELRAAETGGEPSFGLTALFPERVVVDVEPGGGAERAGVRVGDLVQSVDGRPVQGDRTVSLPSPTDGGRPARTVLALRRGRGDRARQLQVTVEAAGVSEVRPPTVRRLSAGVGALELFGVASAEGRGASATSRRPTTGSAGSSAAGPAGGWWTCDATLAARRRRCCWPSARCSAPARRSATATGAASPSGTATGTGP
jgi:hypothetical protein